MTPTWKRLATLGVAFVATLTFAATAAAIPADPPPNDDVADAIVVTSNSFDYEGTTVGATTQKGELDDWCTSNTESVWFTFTADTTGLALIDGFSYGWNSWITVFKGTPDTRPADLTVIGCWGDTAVVDILEGTTYMVRIGGSDGSVPTAGDYSFHYNTFANHLFANSQVIDGLPAHLRGANYYWYYNTPEEFNQEAGEPRPCGNIGATMWYRYTAEATTPMIANTFDVSGDSGVRGMPRTNFDTVLAVYSGPADATFDDLTLLGCNDDHGSGVSRVPFDATTGGTYWFQVGGFNADDHYGMSDRADAADTRVISGSFGIYDLSVSAACRGRAATVVGTDGDDTLVGTNGRDIIAGLGGDDTISGLAGRDIICGGPGDDMLYGDQGPDRLFGQGGSDHLFGGGRNDRLSGGPGFDYADGGRGADVCIAESILQCEI